MNILLTCLLDNVEISKREVSCLSLQGVKELTQTYTAQKPVFLLLSAWLNFNIPSEIELLHNDDSKSVKQILMFSSSQGITKLVFHTVIWESEYLGNWWLIYIVQQIVFLVIYLLLFTKRLPYLANPSWPWYLSSCLS